jgi:hypothetical protein
MTSPYRLLIEVANCAIKKKEAQTSTTVAPVAESQ